MPPKCWTAATGKLFYWIQVEVWAGTGSLCLEPMEGALRQLSSHTVYRLAKYSSISAVITYMGMIFSWGNKNSWLKYFSYFSFLHIKWIISLWFKRIHNNKQKHLHRHRLRVGWTSCIDVMCAHVQWNILHLSFPKWWKDPVGAADLLYLGLPVQPKIEREVILKLDFIFLPF